MPIINNAFNGKLNLDVSNYRISNGDFILKNPEFDESSC